MKSLAIKQPINDSSKQKYFKKKTQLNLRSHSVSHLSTGMPLLQRKCACGGGCPRCQENLGIQTKLKIGKPGDKYEQEADRVAEQITQRTDSSVQTERDHPSQGSNIPRIAIASGIGLEAESNIRLNLEGGRPLSSATRQFMEPRFGKNLSHIRLHEDREAHRTASQIHARAFTYGHHIWLGDNENERDKKLIAHELTHVVQQENTDDFDYIQRFLTCEPESACPDRDTGEIGRSRKLMKHADITSGGVGFMIFNFTVNSSDIQGELLTTPAWDKFMGEVSSHSHRWEILGFTDCHGAESDNLNLRTARATSLYLVMPPHAQSQVDTYQAAPIDQCVRSNTTEEGRSLNRSALIWLRTSIWEKDDFTPLKVKGKVREIICPCDPDTKTFYDVKTFRFVTSIKSLIRSVARSRGVPILAVAGAIADEYNTRRGVRVVIDSTQDAVIDVLPELFIDVDRFFDIKAKLLNTLENDVGSANIKVRTALELVQSGELTVPGSPISDVQVNVIVDFLLTKRGTVETAIAVIEKAQRLFGRHLGQHSDALSEAVLVEYFKQGDSYYSRFSDALATNPDHKVCPGDGGCRVLHNRDRILEAL